MTTPLAYSTTSPPLSSTAGATGSGVANTTTGSTQTQSAGAMTSNLVFGNGLPPVDLSAYGMSAQPGAPFVFPTHLAVGQKPPDFDGTDYKKWSAQFKFYLTTLKVARFIDEVAPILTPEQDGETENF